MIAKRLFQTSLFKSFSSPFTKMTFSDNKWKDREQSAQKVYINTQESTLHNYLEKTLSQLLHKLEEQEFNSEARQCEFETRLKQIVSQHKITNSAAFVAEIINLHRSM